jgi:hypothetical protein
VPQHQGSGRFDLHGSLVWYLGESPEHAVSEVLQGFRGRPFLDGALRRFGHRLALMEVEVPAESARKLVDLDDPAELVRFGLRPGMVASDDRKRTQEVATTLYENGAAGLRWWSKLSGDWHTTVLFLARVPVASLRLGAPEPLTREHPAVVRACRHLAIALR